MKISTITVNEFLKGNDKQNYFRQGRKVIETNGHLDRKDIETYCKCGFVSLKPTNDFEEHNGGLNIKRSKVTIYDDDNHIIIRLRPRKIKTGKDKGYDDIMLMWQCNACGNDWK